MTITNVKEYDILPSRWDYFERRMEKLKEAAGRKIPPIPFDYTAKPATTRPLDALLIPRAMRGSVPDARQLANGNWVRDVIPVKIEYGDLLNPKFDYIGYVTYGEVKDTAGQLKKRPFPYIAKDAAMSDEDHEKRVAELTPRLQAIGDQWTSTKSVKCELCNPKGDGVSRHAAYIVQAKEDVKQKGRLQPQLDLKKGDILQLGSACLSDFMGLDVDKIAAFYELDRAVGAYGPNGSPSNPAGWGYKEMGVYDYAERLVMYYGQREREYLSSIRKALWELPNSDEIYNPGIISKLMDKSVYYGKGEGCFVGGANPNSKGYEKNPYNVRTGNRLMRGRVFNIYEKDPTQDPQWMFQPFTGTGSVEDMKELWEDGLNDAFQYQKVMVVNEGDGTPVIDEVTGDIVEVEVKVPSAKFILDKLQMRNYSTRKEDRKWKLAIVPVMPPAADNEFVKDTTRRMMDWIKNLDVNASEYKGQADLLVRLKNTVELGYVGEKTVREAPQIWRMFSLHDFKRRQKQDYKTQRKRVKETNSAILANSVTDGKWFTVKDLENNRDMRQYVTDQYNYRERNRALQIKYDMVYLTQDQFDAFPAYVAKKEADRKAREEERRKFNEYRDKIQAIFNQQRQNMTSYRRPYMRQVPYEPDVDDFLKVMGWESLADDKDRMLSQATGLIRVNLTNDTVRQAYLTDDELQKVQDAFRPQMMTPQGLTPSTPTPPPAPTMTPPKSSLQTRPKISMAAAKRLLQSNRPANYAYPVGKELNQIEGYCAMVSRPFFRRGMSGQGRTVTLVDTLKNEVYVFFYYGSNLPQVGNYYNVFDTEVAQHSEFRGLKQLVLEDIDGGQVEFIDATSP